MNASLGNKRRRTKLRVAVIGLGILLGLVIVGLLATDSGDQKLAWLTPAEFAQRAGLGPLTGFKNKLKNWTAPIWRTFQSARPRIQIEGKLLMLSPAAGEGLNLGAPISGADGQRAWVLTPGEANALQERLATNPAVSWAGAASGIMTEGNNAWLISSPGKVTATQSIVAINLISKYRSDAIHLILNATAKTFMVSMTNGVVRTNFAAACQATVASGGSLVLDSHSAKDEQGKQQWLILTPRIWTPAKKNDDEKLMDHCCLLERSRRREEADAASVLLDESASSRRRLRVPGFRDSALHSGGVSGG